MTIRSRFAAGGMAAALTLSGVTAAALGTSWAVAAETGSDAATATDEGTTPSPDGTSRADRIEEALAGLVEDGTITQQQASAVAQALADSDALHGGMHGPGHGPGGTGLGHGLDVAAQTLGLTEEELLSALGDGSTLAEVAQQQGVAVNDLVDALVAAAQEQLDLAVTDGRITQEHADAMAAVLPDRVAEQVQQAWQPRGPGGRMHGMDGERGWGGPSGDPEGTDDSGQTDDPGTTSTEDASFTADV
jgi:hypothetical protein